MSILEKDVVMGTFTHRETYLPSLCKSIRKNLPHITFVLQLADLPINANFNALREKFIQTGKRFWLFLDDDIEFLFPNTVEVALNTMIKNKWAMVNSYSTYDNKCNIDPNILQEKEIPWAAGYFQLIDSALVGNIKADEYLPDPNTSIDTTYCCQIKQTGFKIGIAPTYVYHQYKPWIHANKEVIETTNKYLMQRYGQQYFDWFQYTGNIIGEIPAYKFKENRDKLLQWQKDNNVEEPGKVKLNIGCGLTKYDGFINCDITEPYDEKYDITQSARWEDNSVDHINCHHVLEHIPYRLINFVLKEWYRILKIGGTIDLGMPDIEEVCKSFIESDEDRKWNWCIYTLFGQQGTTEKSPWLLTESDPIDEGQFHKGGLTKNRLCYLLEELGFKIIESYNYDGWNTPSLFVYAIKER
jgi:SAM-dependent methyltransferase